MSYTSMAPSAAADLSRQRNYVLPQVGDTLASIAARELPELPADQAMAELQSWNLHIFMMRQPPGLLTGSDVVFVEPPLPAADG